jgi:vancomycin resistance protein YoaR
MGPRTIGKIILVLSVIVAINIGAIIVFKEHGPHGKIMQGLAVAGIQLGGIDYETAAINVDKAYEDFVKQEILITLGEETKKTLIKNLGVEFNTIATIEQAYKTSVGSSALEHIYILLQGMGGIEIDPIYTIDENIFKNEIKRLYPDIRDSENAHIVINDNGKIEIIEEAVGMTVNFTDAYFQLLNGIENLELDSIKLTAIELIPEYQHGTANLDAQILESMLSTEIVLKTPENAVFNHEIRAPIQTDWLEVRDGLFIFNEKNILNYLEERVVKDVNKDSEDATITKLPPENSKWAEIEGVPRDGQRINVNVTLQRLIDNIERGIFETELALVITEGKFINKTGEDLGKLKLLGQGRSNFAGSPWERAANIKKGLNERINKIVILPEEVFSFNSYLGYVTNENGWLDALTIFADQELKPEAGGGLCQVSTTTYRAILKAGLDIIEKSNHSLYVHYYRAYGNGLDAAIFPGSKDLKFINDTEHPIIILSYTEGNDAFVNIYGTPDGRKVELIGPRIEYLEPEENKDTEYPILQKIYWTQKITRPKGEVEENHLVSTYRTKS